MGKEHSHDVIRRLIAGKEEDVMRGLLSIDRIFEALCVEITVKPQIISGDFRRLYKVEIPVTVCG